MTASTTPENCWLVGAGGHAKVVIDALLTRNCDVSGLFDDDSALLGKYVNGVKTVGPLSEARAEGRTKSLLHLAIGDNRLREKLAVRIKGPWCTAVHATAWISDAATIGDGVLVGARAVVQCDAVIGDHAIVNTGAIIEHDVRIEDFAHIAPGTVLGGGVMIGKGSLVGSGAIVLPLVRIGRWCTIGAGAAVTRDVADGVTVIGVPAHPYAT